MALFPLFRPIVFAIDAERAHRLTIGALKLMPARPAAASDPVLAVDVAGLAFPNPIGLAAGFDKDAEVFRQMLGFGFGFVEVGTITPLPQAGNPKPRLFRLAEDHAVINRMGFNNGGLDVAKARLAARRQGGIVGINVGANKDSADRIADYVHGIREAAPLADYLTVNISSPNTPGLRALQDKAALDDLLAAAVETRGSGGPPLFLKVAPDLEHGEIEDISAVAMKRAIDGIIVANTTIQRPPLKSNHRNEAGGLSGRPLKALALERLRAFRRATGGAVPLIAAGGVESGADAYARIRAGASLVQFYSALVYHGPGLARTIARDLRMRVEKDGFSTLREAIGSE